ncbi:DoxX family protein [Heyndrickxia acidiproducens]|uniref:DoxX family protein n=1 Tax=Heyndrickxia acidiproducens TaxID=1121084 RepID=UPI0003641188|nr:DoxX family protein [Heyndrickxia acidiproducens]
MKWYHDSKISIIWAILRIWLGVQWLGAGIEKITGGFDASGFLKGALAQTGGENPAVQGWYASFISHFALPNVELFNVLVPYGELLVGIGLIVGLATIPALLAGALMNLNFMLAGTTSTNPVLYTVAIILLFTGSASYFWGLDRFAVPAVKKFFHKQAHKPHINKGAA